MESLRRLHFWLGLAGVVTFLWTGQYMDRVHGHLEGMPNDVRMLFRSSHIYFLLVSVTNLTLGLYLRRFSSSIKRVLQYGVSVVLLISPFLILAGFFTEPQMDDLFRPYTRPALYGLFGASIAMIVMEVFGGND